MLADELNVYKERGNTYVDDNIQEIQELYKEEEIKKERKRIEDEEVILIKLYEVSKSTSSKLISSTIQSSFIKDKVDNLLKYMKFICTPTQTRIFRPLPHYQSLKSRGEQDYEFWKEVATAFVDKKHNTETLRNSYPIIMFQ